MFGLFSSNPVMGIGLTISLNDQFSRKAAGLHRVMGALHDDANAAIRANLQQVRNVGFGMAAFGLMGTRAMGKVIKDFGDFEFQLKSVQAITGRNPRTGNLIMDNDAMYAAGEAAKEIGKQFGMLPTEVASAMLQFSKAGVEGTASLTNMTRAAAALASAADEQLGGETGVAEMFVNIMKQFNKGESEAMDVADKLSKAANLSTIDIRDLFESIKYGAAVTQQLRIPMEDVLTMFTLIGNAGIKGSMGGVALMNMFEYLARATGKFGTKRQYEALSLFGISPSDLVDQATGKLKDIRSMLTMFLKAAESMTPIQQSTAMTALLGKRGPRAFGPLMRLIDDYDHISEKVNSAGGTAMDTAMMRLQSYEGMVRRFKATWKIFMMEVGETLVPLAMGAMKVLTPVVKLFTAVANTRVGSFMFKVAAGITVVTGLIGALLIPIASIGILITQGKVAWATMRTSTIWAINSIISKLWELITVQRIYNQSANAGNLGVVWTRGKNGYMYQHWAAGSGKRGFSGPPVAPGAASTVMGGIGGAARNFTGVMGSIQRALTKFGGAISMLGVGIMAVTGFINQQYGSAIGAALGGALGFFWGGGPMGAMVGMGIGEMLGSQLDNLSKDSGVDRYSMPTEDYKAPTRGEFGWGNNAGATVNVYVDGKQQLQKIITQAEEDVYLNQFIH